MTQTTRPVTEAELRGLLAQLDADRHPRDLLVVDAAATWAGPSVLTTDGGDVQIVVGTSALGVRAALVDHKNERVAVLTPLSSSELGAEVMARAWRGMKRSPSAWDSVRALFRVEDIDPRLRKQSWMVELLVSAAPSSGYPSPVGAVLTDEVAWATVCTEVLGLPNGAPTVAHLLQWVMTAAAKERLDRLSDESAREVAHQLASAVGPAAPHLFSLARRGAGHDAVALGLVLDAIDPQGNEGPLARLELGHLGGALPRTGAWTQWATTAVEAAEGLDPDQRVAVVARAEDILEEIRAPRVDSTILPRGLKTATDTAVALLGSFRDGDATDADATAAVEAVGAHAEASDSRVRALRALVRLLRRQRAGVSTTGDDGSLKHRSRRYVDDGAWVDAARHDLAHGDTDDDLAALAASVLGQVDDERRGRDHAFSAAVAAQATAAAQQASITQSEPLRIEQVLDTVVAPLADDGPVLLLVLDGLSHAASLPIIDDLTDAGWRLVGPEGRQVPAVISALPSVTVVSRASLLTGQLTTGGQDVEREGFHGHARLAGAGATPPMLFHKRDLRSVDGLIAPDVLAALQDPEQRVVGVVFNGVDDFLGGGDLLELRAGLEGLPLLRPLLNAALACNRRVILTSDHGHVLGGDRYIVGPGGGERFRLRDNGPPTEGEIELSGGRVLRGDGTIVAASDNDVRYNPAKKHGYHGGATPAEVLCPLLVLTSQADIPDGWAPLVRRPPSWWTGVEEVVVDTSAPAPAPTSPSAVPTLFDEPSAPVDWIEELLTSDRLAAQRALAGRATADDDTVRAVLRVLDANGDVASAALLEQHLKVPAVRLRGKLQAVRSLLDVDGYAVLTVEQDGAASLNRALLASQFEVDVPDPRHG